MPLNSKRPAAKSIRKNEMQMAKQLIESMASEWKPKLFGDEYHRALEKMIDKKIQSGGKPAPAPANLRPARRCSDPLCRARRANLC
jgi:non-homologous end joining protein Ku